MESCCENKTHRTDEEKKKITNRLNRIIGQLNGISKMIKEDRYCPEILMQLSASKAAINSLASEILDQHVHSCVAKGIKQGDEEVLDELVFLFKNYK